MSVLAAVAAVALGHGQLDPNVISWRTYKSGSQSGAQEAKIVEILTPAAYQAYLGAYAPEGAGGGGDIDWSREQLVAIHIGRRPTTGYSVAVDTIEKAKAGVARVVWSELTPPRGVSVGQSLTSPWTIIRFNRTGFKLDYVGRKEEGSLPGGIKIIGFPSYERCACCAGCVRDHLGQLPWVVYASGDDAPVAVASTCVMSSQMDFDNYVRNYNMPGVAEMGGVDWYRDRLIAIHLGRKMTPGYQILINHIDIVDSRRVDVSYTQIEPTGQSYGPGTPRGAYLLVRVPRIGSLVTFTRNVARDISLYARGGCGCGCPSCRACGG